MLGRIEAAYRARAEGEMRAQGSEERMRQLVADAGHEVRTPLAGRGWCWAGPGELRWTLPGLAQPLFGVFGQQIAQ
jgi:hypothetical protein